MMIHKFSDENRKNYSNKRNEIKFILKSRYTHTSLLGVKFSQEIIFTWENQLKINPNKNIIKKNKRK